MTIAELAARSKAWLDRLPPHALTAALIVLASTASFGLGLLEGREGGGTAVSVTELATTTPGFLKTPSPQTAAAAAAVPPSAATTTIPAGGEVVASKSGTKYYLPWCGGAKLIKDENKVWFASPADAQAHGYGPAANCKGL